MPELPDVTVYIERLDALVTGCTLQQIRVASPFLVRTFQPPLKEAEGRRVLGFERLGKRIVLCLEGEVFLVIHLMIAGRFKWREAGAALPRKLGLAAFDFESATLLLTEAGTKRRASLHVLGRRSDLSLFDRGGVEPLSASCEEFAGALIRENRTLKRALTDPRILSGIGNAYSDEILFHAQLSPVKRTSSLKPEELRRLYSATRETLELWTARLREQVGAGFPEKVTAFHRDMAVHGKYRSPCPRCATQIQRIRHADNEIDYCPRCQTGGKVLADRSLSRLLRRDWPQSIDELEELEERRSSSLRRVP